MPLVALLGAIDSAILEVATLAHQHGFGVALMPDAEMDLPPSSVLLVNAAGWPSPALEAGYSL